MLNIHVSFLACTKVELWDLRVCIAVNGEKFRSHTVTLTMTRQCPISNLSGIFSYTTMCLNFMLLDRLLYPAKTHTNTHIHTQMHAHTDSDEYSIVAFCKNATITRKRFSEKLIVAFTNSAAFIVEKPYWTVYYCCLLL